MLLMVSPSLPLSFSFPFTGIFEQCRHGFIVVPSSSFFFNLNNKDNKKYHSKKIHFCVSKKKEKCYHIDKRLKYY